MINNYSGSTDDRPDRSTGSGGEVDGMLTETAGLPVMKDRAGVGVQPA